MSDLEVRPARPEEYDELGRITAGVYADDGFVSPGSRYAIKLQDAAARARRAVLLAAVDKGTLVGTVTFCPPGSPLGEVAAADEAEIRMLAVLAEARGRGVGEALVAFCMEQARRDEARRIVLSSQSGMTSAHRLYERLGFERTPGSDWTPEPGVVLLAYAHPL